MFDAFAATVFFTAVSDLAGVCLSGVAAAHEPLQHFAIAPGNRHW